MAQRRLGLTVAGAERPSTSTIIANEPSSAGARDARAPCTSLADTAKPKGGQMPNGTRKIHNTRNRDRHRGADRPANSRSSKSNAGRNQADTYASAKRSYERYMALARDAVSAGDTIEGENFYQHAEHYLRTMRAHGAGREEHEESLV
jgi:hypothetical protein